MSHAATLALNRARALKPSAALSSANFRAPFRAASASVSTASFVVSESAVNPSLAGALRPAALNQWLMPYLAAMTPQYVEMLLRQALYGSHVAAMELFTVMIDSSPEIAACVQEWTEGVLQKRVIYDPYHEEDEEPSELAIEKAKIVSAALRNMRPDATRDENGLTKTIQDIAFARFHGLSVLAVEWNDTYGDGSRFIRNVPNLGSVQCVRSTYWVHPVCYAMDTTGKLGLNIPKDKLAEASRDARAQGSNLFDDNISFGQQNKSRIAEFPQHDFLIAINKSKTGSVFGGSCLRPLAWWWLASNFCGDYLMKYAELFGIPLRKATYDPNTPDKVKREIRQLLQAAGSEPWTMMPKGAEIEFERASGGGGDSPQAFLFTFANEMFRKVILHQTMAGGQQTAGTGAGRAGMESESEGPKKDCVDAGAQFVSDVLNLQLVPSILTLNYGEDGDMEAPTIRLVDVEVGGVADAQRDQILAQTIDVPDSYLRRKYGVPKMGPNDKVAGVETGTLGAAAVAAKEAADQAATVAKAQAEAAQRVNTQPGGQNAPNGAQDAGNEPLAKDKEDDGSGVEARNAIEAGDVAGHEFHGNQFTSSSSTSPKDTADVLEKHISDELNGFEPHNFHPHWSNVSKEEKVGTVKELARRGLVSSSMGRKKNPPTAYELMQDMHNHRKYVTSGLQSKNAEIQASAALAETVNPLVQRLKKISEIKDKAARVAAYKKFLEEQPKLVERMKESGALADETEQIATAQFEKGLKARVALQAGDVAGHEFHGNQWTAGANGTMAVSDARHTLKSKHGISREVYDKHSFAALGENKKELTKEDFDKVDKQIGDAKAARAAEKAAEEKANPKPVATPKEKVVKEPDVPKICPVSKWEGTSEKPASQKVEWKDEGDDKYSVSGVKVVRETEKAWLVSHPHGEDSWLPKSQVKIDGDKATVPGWLRAQKFQSSSQEMPVRLIGETDKAWVVGVDPVTVHSTLAPNVNKVFLPKSQVERTGQNTLRIPAWLKAAKEEEVAGDSAHHAHNQDIMW